MDPRNLCPVKTMDTNIVAAVAAAIAAQQPVPAAPVNEHTMLLIVGMIIAAVAPTLAAIAAYFSSRAAKSNTEETKKLATNTAETVEKVHTAVNSERTAMLTKLQNLSDEILRISKDLSTTKEHQRGQELAAAKLSAPAPQPIFNPIPLQAAQTPSAAPVVEHADAIAEAIKSIEPLQVEDVTAKKK